MSTGTKVVIGILVGAIALGITCVGGVIAFGFWVSGQTPEGITMSFEYPDDIIVGDEFNVTITIENLLDESRTLIDLDFYNSILDGVSIVSFDPIPDSDDGASIAGSRTVSFNLAIPAEDEIVLVVTMTAEEAGFFTGDVDVSIDGFFSMYSTTQTIVIEEP